MTQSRKPKRVFVGDFETTVYEGQTSTEVWASALVELYTDDVVIFHSIDETFDFMTTLDSNIIVYYHNLKFDGAFWLDFFLRVLNYKQAYTEEGDDFTSIDWIKKVNNIPNNTIQYLISETGQFYSIKVKVKNHIIEIRDSLKLIPFSVKEIGKSFDTQHKKLNIEYVGKRYAGCEITEEEKKYIANDVLVVKEALEIMFNEGHDKLTIGACCLSEFRQDYPSQYPEMAFRTYFPDISKIKLDKEKFGSDNADAYVRKAYRGGWCYVAPRFQSKVLDEGFTLDVNSLYPSMMHGSSNNMFPVRLPTFWEGEIPEFLLEERDRWHSYYFFVRVKVIFRIKPDHLPFIQVKNSFMYQRNTSLTTSNYIDKEGKEHLFFEKDGKIIRCSLTLTLTQTDYFLFLKHYNIESIEYLDGCYFNADHASMLFDKYIDKYKKIKMNSTGGRRTLAKLYLNNLYGKLATSDNSSFKVGFVDEETQCVKFFTVPQFKKQTIYIPIGAAITSYARNFTITAAQANYERFVYADTDSIHCVGNPEDAKGVTLDNSEFSCWKLEGIWDIGYFTRQKTYIEHIVNHGDPYYDVKCAGMPDRCKNLFIRSLTGDLAKEGEDLTDEQREFLSVKRELKDFDIGLKIPGKLKPKRITGGIILTEEEYTMRE